MRYRTSHAATDTGQQLTPSGRQHGFTLVELMITIAIIGILAAIAVPSYREHVRRGAVEEALAELSSARVALEQRFLDNRSYAGACPAGTARFTFDCPTLGAETYTLRATGNGNVDGFVYTLTQTGARTSAGPWGSGSCWIARKGDAC